MLKVFGVNDPASGQKRLRDEKVASLLQLELAPVKNASAG
jgi:hypothetical protein